MTALNALFALAALVALGILVYGPWQDVCTAYGRQLVFEKRDAIFDLATAGRLSFNSAEYRTIRMLLEKSIRFAHEISVPRIAFYYVLLRVQGKDIPDTPELIKTVERIENEQTRELVAGLVYEALTALVVMAVLKSPITMLFIIPFYLFVLVFHIGRKLFDQLRDHSRVLIQIEAERVGASVDAIAA